MARRLGNVKSMKELMEYWDNNPTSFIRKRNIGGCSDVLALLAQNLDDSDFNIECIVRSFSNNYDPKKARDNAFELKKGVKANDARNLSAIINFLNSYCDVPDTHRKMLSHCCHGPYKVCNYSRGVVAAFSCEDEIVAAENAMKKSGKKVICMKTIMRYLERPLTPKEKEEYEKYIK